MSKLPPWLKGALVAFADGVLVAASAQLVTGATFTKEWATTLFTVAVVGGLTSLGRYIQRSPLTPPTE